MACGQKKITHLRAPLATGHRKGTKSTDSVSLDQNANPIGIPAVHNQRRVLGGVSRLETEKMWEPVAYRHHQPKYLSTS